MKLPPGKTEEQVLQAIQTVANTVAPSFAFSYFSREDIIQEAIVLCLQALPKYDPRRELEPFLYRHCFNRLCNIKRKILRRTDHPCFACHQLGGCGPNGEMCKVYENWMTRNLRKASLACPLDLSNLSDEKEERTRENSHVEEDVQVAELQRLVDESLPVEMRSDYLKIKAGVSIPKARRQVIEEKIKEILKWDENGNS